MEAYTDFAQVYDTFMDETPYEEWCGYLVELLEKILAICPEGGTVLDCFMGSGSTGVACITTGRRFIGIELDKGYFETAARRITEEAAQYTLFDAGGGH